MNVKTGKLETKIKTNQSPLPDYSFIKYPIFTHLDIGVHDPAEDATFGISRHRLQEPTARTVVTSASEKQRCIICNKTYVFITDSIIQRLSIIQSVI